MLSPEAKTKYKKQGYALVGEHSAVKTCGWTKNMIRGRGGCYKLTFYGIRSNQCIQMSSSLSCANRCTFCWRDYKAPVSKNWKWGVDEPDFILEESIKAHHKLLTGFGGSINTNPHKIPYKQSKIVRHVALSLTGEPIMYPKINELVEKFHEKGISTFLVTNAQYPEAIKNLKPITQLYLSLDAPDKKTLKKIDVPLFPDFWERLNKSLEYLSKKKQRTCIRLTLIKNYNMFNLKGYSDLIKKGDPDFVEVKAYMHVGASQQRLKRENMPKHDEVFEFTKKLNKFLPDYEISAEHKLSSVVLLAKKSFKKKSSKKTFHQDSPTQSLRLKKDDWHTWIDFEKFVKLALSGKQFKTEDYLRKTPTECLIKQ